MHERPTPSPARYAVLYRERAAPTTAGALLVTEEGLLLDGRTGKRRSTLSIPFAEITDIHIGRAAAERLNGHAALVLERRREPPVDVAPLGPGLLHEVADLVAAFTPRHRTCEEQVAVIVPLKTGCQQRARELVAQGPPFNPAALGLTAHQVFVRERDVVFLFTGPNVHAKIEQAIHKPTLWHAGLAWRDCIAGRPRLASLSDTTPIDSAPLYSWNTNDE